MKVFLDGGASAGHDGKRLGKTFSAGLVRIFFAPMSEGRPIENIS
jgi:hypothetical protein